MKSSKEFLLHDFGKTLFPMETSRYLVQNGEQEIRQHIARCLDQNEGQQQIQFQGQTRVYATKPQNHLRRTLKLDPVGEFYLYDTVFKNKSRFRKPFHSDKKHFGYRFHGGKVLNPTESYSGYKKAIAYYRTQYTWSLCFDVASYFNSIYHHDLVAWFANLGVSTESVEGLGQFLRQINSGRTIDCLPQGLYPTKMIGNDYLRFVEQHHGIKSPAILRFMDDVVLFADQEDVLWEDFNLVQRLLGDKGLSVNPSKSKLQSREEVEFERQIDEVKVRLLKKRRLVLAGYDGDDDVHLYVPKELDDDELEYVRNLLKSSTLQEEDAELVLNIFQDHPTEVAPHLPEIALHYPHLAKNIWYFCRLLHKEPYYGPGPLAEGLEWVVKHQNLQEYQLFWFAWILQDYLMDTPQTPLLIDALYNHKNATDVSKAKILEIGDNRYGLAELRDANLVTGRSDWLAWASAVGHRNLPAISRNHKLSYLRNSSPMNELITSVVGKR